MSTNLQLKSEESELIHSGTRISHEIDVIEQKFDDALNRIGNYKSNILGDLINFDINSIVADTISFINNHKSLNTDAINIFVNSFSALEGLSVLMDRYRGDSPAFASRNKDRVMGYLSNIDQPIIVSENLPNFNFIDDDSILRSSIRDFSNMVSLNLSSINSLNIHSISGGTKGIMLKMFDKELNYSKCLKIERDKYVYSLDFSFKINSKDQSLKVYDGNTLVISSGNFSNFTKRFYGTICITDDLINNIDVSYILKSSDNGKFEPSIKLGLKYDKDFIYLYVEDISIDTFYGKNSEIHDIIDFSYSGIIPSESGLFEVTNSFGRDSSIPGIATDSILKFVVDTEIYASFRDNSITFRDSFELVDYSNVSNIIDHVGFDISTVENTNMKLKNSRLTDGNDIRITSNESTKLNISNVELRDSSLVRKYTINELIAENDAFIKSYCKLDNSTACYKTTVYIYSKVNDVEFRLNTMKIPDYIIREIGKCGMYSGNNIFYMRSNLEYNDMEDYSITKSKDLSILDRAIIPFCYDNVDTNGSIQSKIIPNALSLLLNNVNVQPSTNSLLSINGTFFSIPDDFSGIITIETEILDNFEFDELTIKHVSKADSENIFGSVVKEYDNQTSLFNQASISVDEFKYWNVKVNGSNFIVFPKNEFNVIDGGNMDVKVQVELGYSITSIMVNGFNKPISDNIYLENVTSDIIIDIVTEVDNVSMYEVTASVSNGSIENFVTRYVLPGQNLTYKVIPDDGYYLEKIYVNGQLLDNSKINFITDLFILENIMEDTHISIDLIVIPKAKYDLTLSVSDILMLNYISEPTGLSNNRLTEDSSIEIYLDPKFGNAVKNISINGTIYTASSGNITILTNRLIISDIKMAYNIIFNIEEIPLTPYKVTTFSGVGYNMEVGEFVINKDSFKSFNIQVLEGFKPEYTVRAQTGLGYLSLIDGSDFRNPIYGRIIRQGNDISFYNVDKDYTISDTNIYLEVTCAKKTYEITIPTVPLGTINVNSHTISSGKITVEHGDSIDLNLVPDAGYKLNTIVINGVSQAITNGNITIPNVISAITITASFVIIPPEKHYISVSAINCTVDELNNGEGSFEIDEGSNLSFQISAIDKYRYDTISVTGGTYVFDEASKTITITNVRSNYNITVSYVTRVFTVNSQNNEGCTISPLGNNIVEYGNSLTFDVTMTLGYRLTGYLIDGSIVVSTSNIYHTIINITTNKTIMPLCEKIPVRLTMVSGSPTSHSISPTNLYYDLFYGEDSPEMTISPAITKYVKTVKLLRPDDSVIRILYSNNTPVNETVPISGKLVKVTVDNIIEDCKFLVETDDVAIVNYSINVSGNSVGTSNGAHTVRFGNTFSASFAPTPGSRMTSIVFSNRTRVDFVGGRTTAYTFDFTNVTSDESVTVNQELIPIPKRRVLLIDENSTQKHTITINGQDPSVKDIMIEEGTSVTVTLTPSFVHLDYYSVTNVKITNTIDASGPAFADVSVGDSWGVKTYTFVVGTNDLYRIDATSARIDYTIYPDSVINGTTSLVQTTRHYNLIDYFSFTITPNANYELDHVTMYHQYTPTRQYSTDPARVGSTGTIIDSTNTRDVYMIGNTIYYRNSSQFRVTIAFKEKIKYNVKLFTNPNGVWTDASDVDITSGALGVHVYNSVNYDCRVIPVYAGGSFYAKFKFNTGYIKDHVTSTKGLFLMGANGNPKGTQLASATIDNTFSNISGDVGISMDTKLTTYTISAGTLTNGTVTGTGSVNHGSSNSVVFTPNSGYKIASITKDGVAMTGINTAGHTDNLTNITANVTYVVVFEVSTVSITFSSSGSDYSIKNISNVLVTGTTVNVTPGSDYNFRITVSTTKAILNVRLNINGTNIDLGSVSDYTLTSITSNITVNVITDDKLLYDFQYLSSKTYSITDGLVIKKGGDGRYWLYRINVNNIIGIDPETNFDTILSGTTTNTYTKIGPMIPHNISTGIYTPNGTNSGNVQVNFNFNTASISGTNNTQYVEYQYADGFRYIVFHIVDGVLGVYRAKYWTRNIPQVGSTLSPDWERILTPNYKYTSNYIAGAPYNLGDTVFYNGVWYTANFWTIKDPSVYNNVRMGLGADWNVKGTPSTWSSTVTYYIGNNVIRHNGVNTYVFIANKTSLNKDPNDVANVSGDNSKEWSLIGRLV